VRARQKLPIPLVLRGVHERGHGKRKGGAVAALAVEGYHAATAGLTGGVT